MTSEYTSKVIPKIYALLDYQKEDLPLRLRYPTTNQTRRSSMGHNADNRLRKFRQLKHEIR